MNLSCGKCRCVRPFSGEPPKCDTCGWVCTPIDPNEATDTEYWQHLRKVRQGEVPSSALPLPESPQAAIDRVAEAAGAFLKFVGVGIVFVIGAYYANYYLQSDADRATTTYPQTKLRSNRSLTVASTTTHLSGRSTAISRRS
jgi:hypothetical protein